MMLPQRLIGITRSELSFVIGQPARGKLFIDVDANISDLMSCQLTPPTTTQKIDQTSPWELPVSIVVNEPVHRGRSSCLSP